MYRHGWALRCLCLVAVVVFVAQADARSEPAASPVPSFAAETPTHAAVLEPSKTWQALLHQVTNDAYLNEEGELVVIGSNLEKREPKGKEPTTTETPQPWVRTIYSSIKEIVVPTVIGGITFSGKPPAGDGPHSWINLDKKGQPKFVRPKIKDGHTVNGSPDYGTYFRTPTTHTYGYEELKAHNMATDEIFEEVEWLPEDPTYRLLNPIIRCTPDRYYMRGQGLKRKSSEPICTPHHGVKLVTGKTYFITWFTRFFPEGDRVRLHLAYVEEKHLKREESEVSRGGNELVQRDADDAFFTSEWMENLDGYYPFEIDPEWLLGKYTQHIVFLLQPESQPDEEVDFLNNGTYVVISKSGEEHKKLKHPDSQFGPDDNVYMIALLTPTLILLIVCIFYFVFQCGFKSVDVSDVRRKAQDKFRRERLRRFRKTHKQYKMAEDVELDKLQSKSS